MERDQASQLHKQSLAQLRSCKEELQQKYKQLQPLRDAQSQSKQAREALKSSGGELTVRSEEELDAKLAELNRQQQHESLTAKEEANVLHQIKLLRV